MINKQDTRPVIVGLEMGEYHTEYGEYTDKFERLFDLELLDFVLISLNKKEIPRDVWRKWATFFSSHHIYFAFLYSQQKGAPPGKKSHLTEDIVAEVKQIAGKWFVGDMLGEFGGFAGWQEGYFKDSKREKPKPVTRMDEAAEQFIGEVRPHVELDREMNLPAVMEVDATILFNYLFAGGVDIGIAEAMPTNPEVLYAALRGASKAYDKPWWGSHIAHGWYGGFRNEDLLKYKRLELAYLHAFLSGANLIYPENGHFSVRSYGDDFGEDSEYSQMYRSVWKRFSEFIHAHQRPSQGPKVSMAFVQGKDDGWTGWESGATMWNQFNGGDDWVYGPAEQGWELLKTVHSPAPWHQATVYEEDETGNIPYGLYDIVPAESSLATLKQYNYLFFTGWNTMTEETYETLKQYVHQGGRLIMSVAHLNKNPERGGEPEWVHAGDFRDLFGCTVRGKGQQVNWGVKFIEESADPNVLYPYTKSGICDPIAAAGPVTCAEVELHGASVLALMADKFLNWRETSPPILLEHEYGQGIATLVTSWDYPGTPTLRKLMDIVWRAHVLAETQKADIKVKGGDKLRYAVYPTDTDSGTHVVYVLNTDYHFMQQARISCGEVDVTISVGSGSLQMVYLNEQAAICPEHNELTLSAFRQSDNTVTFTAQAEKETQLHVHTAKSFKAVHIGEKVTRFDRTKKVRLAALSVSGSSEIQLETEPIESEESKHG